MTDWPELEPQPEMVERIAGLIPSLAVSERVREWPPDEQRFHREGPWRSFTDRAERLDRIRRVKVARAVLAALRIRADA